MNSAAQLREPGEIDEPRPQAATLEPYKVGDVLPACMSVGDMCRAFPVNGKARGRSSFHRLERRGKFRKFELVGISGDKCWSGAKVQRYLDGEPLSAFRSASPRDIQGTR